MLFQEIKFDTAAANEVGTPTPVDSNITPASFYVEFGRNKPVGEKNIFIRNEYREVNRLTLEQTCWDYIQKHTPDGWGLYMTAFQYDQPDPYKAQLRGDFFLDFDNEGDIRKAQEDALRLFQHLTISPNYKIPANMIKVFFSGKKGIHLTIPYQCFGVEWHPQLDCIYRLMAEELKSFAPNNTLDMAVYERRRLFRMICSRHPSTGSYKVPMELKRVLMGTEADIQKLTKDPAYGSWIRYDRPRTIPEATRYFKEMEVKFAQRFKKNFSKNAVSQTIDFEPPCYEEMIAEGPLHGTRNYVASMLVAFWRQRGLSEQDAWDNLVDWNDESLTEFELKTLFRSNFKGPYIYGCNKIKEYASCPATCKSDCKFYKSL